MKPDFIVHNKVTEEAFEKKVYQWLSEGDYTPDDIIESVVTESNLYYMPVHFIKKSYSGSCSASLGYVRQVFYSEWSHHERRYVQRSRLVTDWYPHSQNIAGQTETLIYAGGKNFAGLAPFIEGMGWKKEELISTTNESFYGQAANNFTLNLAQAYNEIGHQRLFNQAYAKTAQALPSRLYNHLKLYIDFQELSQFSVVAPYWIFFYQYEDKNYYVAVDGCNPERIQGTKPEDSKRKKQVSKLRWIGWSIGIFLSCLLVFGFSGLNIDNIKLTGENIGGFSAGFITTWIIVERKVKNIKQKSLKIRQENLIKKIS